MPSTVTKHTFHPSYTKKEQGIAVLDVKDIPLPKSFVPTASPYIVQFAPAAWGGNHRHRRQEACIGFGEGLVLIWQDAAGVRHEEVMMTDDGALQVFIIPSLVPHMVENRSAHPAVFYELADIDDGPARPLTGADSLRQESHA